MDLTCDYLQQLFWCWPLHGVGPVALHVALAASERHSEGFTVRQTAYA